MTTLTTAVLTLTLTTTVVAIVAATPSLFARWSASTRHALLGVTFAVVCGATLAVGARHVRGALAVRPAGVRATAAPVNGAEPDAPASIQALAPPSLRSLPPWSDALVRPALLVWIAGAALLLAHCGRSVVALALARRRRTPVEEPALRDAVDRCLERLHCRRRVALVWGDARTVPVTWGVLRPVVMLPPEAAQWAPTRRDAVLLHELAHVARYDALTQMLRHVACALHWFNPLVWVLARQHELEAELASDECVVRAGADPFDYAADLVALARTYRVDPDHPGIAVALARSASEVEIRVRALVMRPRLRRTATTVGIVGGVGLSLGGTLALLAWTRPGSPRPPAVVTGLHVTPSRLLGIRAREVTRWRGAVADGRWFEVVGGVGNVRVESSANTLVDVAAQPRGDAAGAHARLVVVQGAQGDVQVCVRDVPAELSAPDCSSAFAASDVPVDFVIRVPSHVRVGAHTRRGNIDAMDLHSQVWATAEIGDVHVSTSKVAEASTDSGDVVARVGARAWTSNVEFTTGRGRVDVTVPAEVSAFAELVAERGVVHSEFALPLTRWRVPQETAVGPLAPSGAPAPVGRLTLRATQGDVYLRSLQRRAD